MANRLASVLFASVLSSAPAAALAQPASAPSTTISPLTVQAAPTPKAIQQQSRSFVQSYAAAPNPEIDQIGRWHDGVCVQVEGLVPAQAAVIKARIESVARAVGLPAARTGCKANVEIVFSDKPQSVIDGVAKRRESLLGYHHPIDTNRLKTVTHPIQAWYQTATRGEGPNAGLAFANLTNRSHDVDPAEPVLDAGYPGQTFDDETVDDPRNTTPTGCADSHFSSCLKSVFRNVFMVADSKAMEGRDLGLVADDMVMLALSQPRSLEGCNALPSVIDRFAKSACPGRDPPDGLTPADAAYLTALYASDPEGKKRGEQGDIAGRMAAMLIPASTAAH
jgi:hypothetical protein